MTKLVILFLCVLCAVAQEQQTVAVPPPGSSTISFPWPWTTTTPKPTPTTTKPTTTTSKSTTTTSTPTPTTTKPTPTSTTPKPSTTTPTTTTPKPTPTTPTPAPTPAPIPVGPPAVNVFTGNYSGSNKICLMMTMELQLELMDKNSTKINVTDAAKGQVTCGNSSSELLEVTWGTNNSILFAFFKNNSQYEIQSINTTVLLPGANTTTTYYHLKPEFAVSEKQSYKCAKDEPINLTSLTSNQTVAKLHVSRLQYQAFMNTTAAQYDSAWYCDQTNTSDVVPVIVGCILAVLVVLVLAAYLIGRRRCQARGYLSM